MYFIGFKQDVFWFVEVIKVLFIYLEVCVVDFICMLDGFMVDLFVLVEDFAVDWVEGILEN